MQMSFDIRKLNKLKKAHAECDGDSFTFDGLELLKSYAGYMIEYLEMRMNNVVDITVNEHNAKQPKEKQ